MTSVPHTSSSPAPIAPLVVRTTPLAPEQVSARGGLLGCIPPAPAGDVFSWVRRGDGIVGWGRSAQVTVRGPGRFEDAQSWWDAVSTAAIVRDEVQLPGSGLVAFGAHAYSGTSPVGSTLVVPEVIIGRREGTTWMTTIGVGDVVPNLLGDLNELAPHHPEGVRFREGEVTAQQYAAHVTDALERIGAGELRKVVLARDLVAMSDSEIDPRFLLGQLAGEYPNTWVFSVDGLVGATPELLVRSDQGLVASRVLAGTISRTGDDERDGALAGALARSSKDLEEHEYAVRSVADALRPHCSSMNVPEAPFVLHLPNVMHLATDVTGVLNDHTSSLELAAALHPSAAVCGTPTEAANTLISELEGMDRGRYAGPVGWIDAAGEGEWGIALRCASYEGDTTHAMRLYAGCGIVAGSLAGGEVSESDAKFIPMRDALTTVSPPAVDDGG